jgi:uncharacterized protein (DUF2336 family)
MGVPETLLADLEDAMQRGTPVHRAATLRRVTDLFLDRTRRLDDEQVSLFDQAIGNLIEEIEIKALVELGGRLAQVFDAPPDVIRRLANHDDIAVSGPVLTYSERLSDSDLVGTAETKSQGHLLAISARRRINEPVTDALMRRDDDAVTRKVAANSGARFSEYGFDSLVERAGVDGRLAVSIAERSDLPADLLRVLIAKATAAVRQRLLAVTHREAHGDIARILEKVSVEVTSACESEALRRVRSMRDCDELGERELAEFAMAGRFDETAATLSLLCGIPIETVDGLLHEDRVDPLLVMCKAVGFEWPTVSAVICLGRAGRAGLDAATVRDEFGRLSRSTAERAMRFWRVRQTTMNHAEDSAAPVSRNA